MSDAAFALRCVLLYAAVWAIVALVFPIWTEIFSHYADIYRCSEYRFRWDRYWRYVRLSVVLGHKYLALGIAAVACAILAIALSPVIILGLVLYFVVKELGDTIMWLFRGILTFVLKLGYLALLVGWGVTIVKFVWAFLCWETNGLGLLAVSSLVQTAVHGTLIVCHIANVTANQKMKDRDGDYWQSRAERRRTEIVPHAYQPKPVQKDPPAASTKPALPQTVMEATRPDIVRQARPAVPRSVRRLVRQIVRPPSNRPGSVPWDPSASPEDQITPSHRTGLGGPFAPPDHRSP